ncbi:MAG: hypothetical protein JSU66_10065 [Deltaproteobacteria bacterium]|nr:MAG: hypothetical protein JSU66_10065 [Deltaproteobacteria bacterium]
MPTWAGYHRCRSFGLRLAANRPIAGLPEEHSADPPDVVIELAPGRAGSAHGEGPGTLWRRHPVRDERGRPMLQVRRAASRDWYHLAYADGTEFVVEREGRRIRGSWPSPFTSDDAATYLLGPVLGFALRLRGVVSLHASVVSIQGAAVAFLGPPGAGKSTLAARFARAGHALVCDDAAALTPTERGFLVQPGPPRVRLWPDSVRLLFGPDAQLPRLTPSWDKRRLDLAGSPHRVAREPVPLVAAYLLGARDGEAPQIGALEPRRALLALIGNSYASFFQEAPMRAREFQLLAELARAVPLRRVRAPEGVDGLAAVVDAVVRDVRHETPGGLR